MSLEPDVERLAVAIRRLESHLRRHDEIAWADGLGRAASLVEMGEAQGLYEFQRMFGGMGSLNDVALHEGDEKLRELRNSAFDLAQEVRRSHLRI